MLWNQYFPDDDEIVFDSQLFQKSLFVVPWVEYQIFRWFDNSLIPWYSDFVKQNVANIQIYIQIYKNIWNAATWKHKLSHIHHFIFLHSLSDFFFQCVISLNILRHWRRSISCRTYTFYKAICQTIEVLFLKDCFVKFLLLYSGIFMK